MNEFYHVVVFAGRVLSVHAMPGPANDWRNDWLKENDTVDPIRVKIQPIAYPPPPYTAAKTMDWINRLLDGSVLDSIVIDPEIA